jgi:hypothetical protein
VLKQDNKFSIITWWTTIVAVIVVGTFAYFYRDVFSGTSEASVLVPPQMLCSNNMLPIGSLYVSDSGQDEDYTWQGKRRGGKNLPFRTLQYALAQPANPYYPAKKITILGPVFHPWPNDLGPNELVIGEGEQVWITGEAGQTQLQAIAFPPEQRMLRFVNEGGQFLIEKIWFDSANLVAVQNGAAPDRDICANRIAYNRFTNTNQWTGEPEVNMGHEPNRVAAGMSLFYGNIVELYDNPEDMTDRPDVGGLGALAGPIAKVMVVNNQFIFPEYGATQFGGAEPRHYEGVQASIWDQGMIYVERNIFTTKEYDPSGETEGVYGIAYSSQSADNIIVVNNDFSSFQGTPFLID